MKTNAFEAILFDFGNVIIDIDFELMFQGFATGSGKSVEIIRQRLTEHQVFRRYESGFLDTAEFYEVIRQTIGYPFNNYEIEAIWNSMLLQIPPNRIELLRYLNTKFPVYLLSNTNELHIQWCNQYLQQKFGIPSVDSLFKKSFLSYQIGMWKPDEAIYTHVLQETNCQPTRMIFFDDNEANVLAARQVGLQVIHVTPTFGILDFFKERA